MGRVVLGLLGCPSVLLFVTPTSTATEGIGLTGGGDLSILADKQGRNISSLVRSLRPIKISAGVRPVAVCGVVRYPNRKRANFSPTDHSSFLQIFMASLNVLTALSASPFEAG